MRGRNSLVANSDTRAGDSLMGQGTWGMDECEYDPREEAMAEGVWIQRDGTRSRLTDMSERHLRNTIRLLTRNGGGWAGWITQLENELYSRTRRKVVAA